MDVAGQIDTLRDDRALWALDYVGRVFAANRGTPPSVVARQIPALDGLDDAILPVIADGRVVGGGQAQARAGTIARYALKAGLADPREDVRRAVETAVAEACEPEVTKEVFTIMLIGGAVLLGLAALAKLEVNADGKLIVHPGLPGIKDAAEAVGTLIKAALGGAPG